jgi:teichuronic acid biosynthesis glycosyltransferase TuaC
VFVRERLRSLISRYPIESAVIAPVPWFPFGHPAFGVRSEFARVPMNETTTEGAVYHPRYFQIPKFGSVVAPWSFANAVLREIDRNRLAVDIIDAHFLFPDGVAAVMTARRLKCPVILTARGSDVNVIPREAVPRRWIKWALRRADGLSAVSADLAQQMRELAGGREVATIRNGVDTKCFQPAEDRESLRASLQMTGFTILSVGNLIDLKGHDIVIDAVGSVADASLIIIGSGPLRERLAAEIRRRGLADRVRLVPSMPQTRLSEYYAAADVLVLASKHEGLPNVVLEALASGTPVIATPTGGAREVLEGRAGGILCERTASSIADAVSACRSDYPNRNDVRAAVERFDWSRTSCDVMSLLQKALTNHGRCGATT